MSYSEQIRLSLLPALLFLILALSPAGAQERKAAGAPEAPPKAEKQSAEAAPASPGISAGFDLTGGPVGIVSDELVFAHEKRQAEFSGHVSATQKDTVVDADSILLTFAPQKEGSGENAPESIEKISAKGNVKIATGMFTASCDQADYEVPTEVLTLTGKPAVLSRGANSVTGAVIVLDQKKQTTKVTGAPQSPVFVRLTPEEKPGDQTGKAPSSEPGDEPAAPEQPGNKEERKDER